MHRLHITLSFEENVHYFDTWNLVFFGNLDAEHKMFLKRKLFRVFTVTVLHSTFCVGEMDKDFSLLYKASTKTDGDEGLEG